MVKFHITVCLPNFPIVIIFSIPVNHYNKCSSSIEYLLPHTHTFPSKDKNEIDFFPNAYFELSSTDKKQNMKSPLNTNKSVWAHAATIEDVWQYITCTAGLTNTFSSLTNISGRVTWFRNSFFALFITLYKDERLVNIRNAFLRRQIPAVRACANKRGESPPIRAATFASKVPSHTHARTRALDIYMYVFSRIKVSMPWRPEQGRERSYACVVTSERAGGGQCKSEVK